MTVQILDTAVLDDLAETTGDAFLADLVATFLADAPTMLADLKSAEAAGDQDGFRRAAHSLKSNASTFGATELADAARALELGGPGAAPSDIDSVYHRTATALQAYLDG